VNPWRLWWLEEHGLWPKPKPPTSPPPHNPASKWTGRPNVPWYHHHVDISHGLRTANGVWTVDELVARLVSAGMKAVTFQVGNDCPDPDWASHGRDLYEKAKAAGLICGAWGRADYFDWATLKAAVNSILPIDGFKFDIEGRCVEPQLPERIVAEWGDQFAMAVVATGGIDDSFGNGAINAAIRWGDHFDFVGQDYPKADDFMTPDRGENFVWWRSTDKNGGKGFRHMPDAGGKWHVTQTMSNAETCTPLTEQEGRLKAWTGIRAFWDGEILEGNGEWPVWQRINA
jgi:hypothetical protein